MSPTTRNGVLGVFGGALLCGFALQQSPHAQTPAALASPTESDRAAAQAAFGQSLALRTDRIVADQTHTLLGWLAQTHPVWYASRGALRLTLTLRTAGANPTVVKNLGETLIFGANLANHPFPFSINLQGVPDGHYLYLAEIRDGDTLLRSLEIPVRLVAGLDEKQAAFEQRLARIQGHDSAKASIRYPFDLARVINISKRVFGSSNSNPEFGLSQAGEPTLYDFSAGIEEIGHAAGRAREGPRPCLARGRGNRAPLLHARGGRDPALPRLRTLDLERQVGAAPALHPARKQPRPGFLLRP